MEVFCSYNMLHKPLQCDFWNPGDIINFLSSHPQPVIPNWVIGCIVFLLFFTHDTSVVLFVINRVVFVSDCIDGEFLVFGWGSGERRVQQVANVFATAFGIAPVANNVENWNGSWCSSLVWEGHCISEGQISICPVIIEVALRFPS